MPGIPSETDRAQAELLAREPVFHRPELGLTREDLLAQTTEDFWEVGASGRVYSREHVVDAVARRGLVDGDDEWVISDVACRKLGPGTYALTYQLDQNGRLSRRLSIWQREMIVGWKIAYHQGTLIQL